MRASRWKLHLKNKSYRPVIPNRFIISFQPFIIIAKSFHHQLCSVVVVGFFLKRILSYVQKCNLTFSFLISTFNIKNLLIEKNYLLSEKSWEKPRCNKHFFFQNHWGVIQWNKLLVIKKQFMISKLLTIKIFIFLIKYVVTCKSD